jgi:hypothetical protein
MGTDERNLSPRKAAEILIGRRVVSRQHLNAIRDHAIGRSVDASAVRTDAAPSTPPFARRPAWARRNYLSQTLAFLAIESYSSHGNHDHYHDL